MHTLYADLDALRAMNDQEAIAYWNICTMSTSMLLIGDDGRNARHLACMTRILDERGIGTSPGRTLSAV
jgi:hypothetical protein